MKFTVLVDNNTLTTKKGMGEPAFSIYIEDEDKKILFDTGLSDLFIKNAELYDINLKDLTSVILSHGHIDHSSGITHLAKYIAPKKIDFIAHPYVINKKYNEHGDIGMNATEDFLNNNFNLKFSKAAVKLTEKLYFLGEIPRTNEFESNRDYGKTIINNKECQDKMDDDTALAYVSNDGLVIITGCSHSGIVNIINHAKTITKCEKIKTILGGWHLFQTETSYLDFIGKTLQENHIETIYPCHCTELPERIYLSKFSEVKEVGVGLSLEFI